ncbi:tetratricopeptide repeat protein [Nanoarchaeota archaeon]
MSFEYIRSKSPKSLLVFLAGTMAATAPIDAARTDLKTKDLNEMLGTAHPVKEFSRELPKSESLTSEQDIFEREKIIHLDLNRDCKGDRNIIKGFGYLIRANKTKNEDELVSEIRGAMREFFTVMDSDRTNACAHIGLGELYRFLGERYSNGGDKESAIECYIASMCYLRAISDADPKHRPGLKNVVREYVKLTGDVDHVAKGRELTAILKHSKTSEERRERLIEAGTEYEIALAINENDCEARKGHATICLGLGDKFLPTAILSLEKEAECDKDNIETKLGLANAYIQLSEIEGDKGNVRYVKKFLNRAKRYSDQAKDIDVENPLAYFLSAKVYFEHGDILATDANIKESIRLSNLEGGPEPDLVADMAYMYLSMAKQIEGNPDLNQELSKKYSGHATDLIDSTLKIIEADKKINKNARISHMKAILLKVEGDLEGAKPYLQEAIDLAPFVDEWKQDFNNWYKQKKN